MSDCLQQKSDVHSCNRVTVGVSAGGATMERLQTQKDASIERLKPALSKPWAVSYLHCARGCRPPGGAAALRAGPPTSARGCRPPSGAADLRSALTSVGFPRGQKQTGCYTRSRNMPRALPVTFL